MPSEDTRAALRRLNAAVTVDVQRIFAQWVDMNKDFREPQLTELREALLQADQALSQGG